MVSDIQRFVLRPTGRRFVSLQELKGRRPRRWRHSRMAMAYSSASRQEKPDLLELFSASRLRNNRGDSGDEFHAQHGQFIFD